MKKRNLSAKKMELSYKDIEKKKKLGKMRLQKIKNINKEAQKNLIKNLTPKCIACTYVVEKLLRQKKKIIN